MATFQVSIVAPYDIKVINSYDKQQERHTHNIYRRMHT